jgi:hypothetical protein
MVCYRCYYYWPLLAVPRTVAAESSVYAVLVSLGETPLAFGHGCSTMFCLLSWVAGNGPARPNASTVPSVASFRPSRPGHYNRAGCFVMLDRHDREQCSARSAERCKYCL